MKKPRTVLAKRTVLAITLCYTMMMAITMSIGGRVIGEGKLYPHKGRRGRAKPAPLYAMDITNVSGSRITFAVTRDTFFTLGYAPCGYEACPPSRQGRPYVGLLRRDGKNGFCVDLYEPGVRFGGVPALKGIGKMVRTHMQIHLGPAKSEGCILLTGWKRGRARFDRAVNALIEEDRKGGIAHPDRVCVIVKKR